MSIFRNTLFVIMVISFLAAVLGGIFSSHSKKKYIDKWLLIGSIGMIGSILTYNLLFF